MDAKANECVLSIKVEKREASYAESAFVVVLNLYKYPVSCYIKCQAYLGKELL